jgi:hypothetical protein
MQTPCNVQPVEQSVLYNQEWRCQDTSSVTLATELLSHALVRSKLQATGCLLAYARIVCRFQDCGAAFHRTFKHLLCAYHVWVGNCEQHFIAVHCSANAPRRTAQNRDNLGW